MNKDARNAEIVTIANDTGLPSDKVAFLFDRVLMAYERRSTVKDYLPIIVSRRVRDLLQKSHLFRRKTTN